jgi:hypothetical protein
MSLLNWQTLGTANQIAAIQWLTLLSMKRPQHVPVTTVATYETRECVSVSPETALPCLRRTGNATRECLTLSPCLLGTGLSWQEKVTVCGA